MRNYIPLFTIILFFFSTQLYAQKDTVFIDVNDSGKVYLSMPNGYSPIDTNDKVANAMTLRMNYYGMNNHPSSTGNKLITQTKVDSLQNLFVHWSFKSSHGISNGTAYFRKDNIVLDSLQLTNDSTPVYYADTFSTAPFDTLIYKEKANGQDSVEFTLGYFQIRTEIRVTTITDLNEISSPNEPKFSIYPNPSQSTISLTHFNSIKSEPYRIFNNKGQTVLSGTIVENQINISTLKAGFYYFQIPNKKLTIKFKKL